MTKDLQKRTLFAVLALAIFLPVLFAGGLLLQIGIGLLAMLGVHELLHMKGLKTMTIEGALTLFATFALTVPLENYLTFLPVDGNVVAYSVLITIMLGTTVFSKNYTIEDAAFPIAVSFYVGFGFNALLDARVAGFDKVLLALFIVWATDSAAYLTGMNFGKHVLKLKAGYQGFKGVRAFINDIKHNNKELYDNLVNEFKNNKKDIKRKLEIINKVQSLYPELSEEEVIEESLVTYLGELSTEKLKQKEEDKSIIQKVLSKFKDFISKIFRVNELNPNTTIEDIAELFGIADNKLLFEGFEYEYTTPDGETFNNKIDAQKHLDNTFKPLDYSDRKSVV